MLVQEGRRLSGKPTLHITVACSPWCSEPLMAEFPLNLNVRVTVFHFYACPRIIG